MQNIIKIKQQKKWLSYLSRKNGVVLVSTHLKKRHRFKREFKGEGPETPETEKKSEEWRRC